MSEAVTFRRMARLPLAQPSSTLHPPRLRVHPSKFSNNALPSNAEARNARSRSALSAMSPATRKLRTFTPMANGSGTTRGLTRISHQDSLYKRVAGKVGLFKSCLIARLRIAV
jgi:hypothetical protein